CRRLRRWRMRWFGCRRFIECTGPITTLVPRVAPTKTANGLGCIARHITCGTCRRLPRGQMRGFGYRRFIECTGPIATLVPRVAPTETAYCRRCRLGCETLQTYCAAAYAEAQAHWKLKPPKCPLTSSTSPMKYSFGDFSDSIVLDDTS